MTISGIVMALISACTSGNSNGNTTNGGGTRDVEAAPTEMANPGAPTMPPPQMSMPAPGGGNFYDPINSAAVSPVQ